MFERFLTIINSASLIETTDKVLLAVSGGLDSMVLVDLFKKTGIDFAICHINYGLRGSDSKEDEQLVLEHANRIGVKFHIKRVSEGEWSENQSIQMAAREIRYDFFDEILDEHGYSKICTAHHINDSLETVLMNFTKGTGISGLTGIPEKRNIIVRPLLSFTKDDLKAYAVEHQVKWREDQSNTSSKYQRNLIRNEVIPILKKINPQLEQTFFNTTNYLKGAQQALKTISENIKEEYLFEKANYQVLELEWFVAGSLNDSVLFEILKAYQMNSSQLENLIKVIVKSESGKEFETDSHHISFDRNVLIIEEKAKTKESLDALIADHNAYVDLPNAQLKITSIAKPITVIRKGEIAFLDKEKLRFPLKLRTWKQGDWFIPFGMKGRKLLSDFMIDLKIPLTLKKDILVLINGSDIVWVLGHRIDDRYKVDSQTKEALMLEYETL